MSDREVVAATKPTTDAPTSTDLADPPISTPAEPIGEQKGSDAVKQPGQSIGERLSKLMRSAPKGGGGTLIGLVVLFIVLSLASSAFLTKANLLNILDQNSETGIIACGLTLVIICANLDFSVAATYGLTSIMVAGLIAHFGLGGAIVLALLGGSAVGLANGLLVVALGIDSFICTLATGFMVAGLTEVVTKGNIVTSSDSALASFGNGSFISVTYASWAFIAVAIALGFFLARTVLGQSMYAVGDNAEAARLSGLRVRMIVVTAFVIAGLAAAIAGTLIAARTSAGQPQDGLDLVVAAIAAVVIGGTSARGGTGSIWRTVVGVLFLGVIGDGLTLLNINPVYQEIIEGAIILVAVASERIQRARAL